MLYYPLSSKEFTFENIFSSESISPPIFYSLRNYGIGYFHIIPNTNLNNTIVLYSSPPVYTIENGIKFLLQIDERSLDMASLTIIDENVFEYRKTIYLNKSNFKILFFSEKEAKISILKSKSSLPTKNLDKYLENFLIVPETNCRQFEINLVEINKSIAEIKFYTAIDKKINHFKGLIYGMAVGIYDKSTRDGIPFKKALREVTNLFAEFKSRISNNDSPKKLKNESILQLSTNLFTAIDFLGHQYDQPLTVVDLDTPELITILFENITHITSLDDAEQYVKKILIDDEINETNEYQNLKNIIINRFSNQSKRSKTATLKDEISLFMDSAGSNKFQDLEGHNLKIKTILHEIERDYSTQLQKDIEKSNLSLESIKYDFMKNEIQTADSFYSLAAEELRDVNIICNTILRYVINEKVAGKELVLRIVEDIGNHFSKTGKQTNLYQYLNNQIDGYSFEKVLSPVLRNFVAFIFNFDSLEKLENFIVNKNIQENWIAYTFWGAFNGFANLSGNFTKTIFSQDENAIQTYIDDYLKYYIDIINDINYDDTVSDIVNENQSDYYINPQAHLIDQFYKKFVEGKYKLTKDQFSSVFSIKDKTAFYNEVKAKFGINKKMSEKLYNSIKRDFDSPLLFT